VKNIKIEDVLKRLDVIVDKLEEGEDELEKIVALYQEGSELISYCNKKLKKIENKITVISEKIKSEE